MVKNKGKRSLIIAISIAGILLIAIIVAIVLRSLGASSSDPYVENGGTTNTTEQSTATPDENNASDSTVPETETTTPESTVDPATLTFVDIVPMSISVGYVKGVGGFEYEILRAQNGTRYVQFSSPELVGTKCTNDAGVFASVLASPTEAESSTLAKTVKVEDITYGLSLAGSTCASDTAKLQQYQKAFRDGFSSLKKLN